MWQWANSGKARQNTGTQVTTRSSAMTGKISPCNERRPKTGWLRCLCGQCLTELYELKTEKLKELIWCTQTDSYWWIVSRKQLLNNVWTWECPVNVFITAVSWKNSNCMIDNNWLRVWWSIDRCLRRVYKCMFVVLCVPNCCFWNEMLYYSFYSILYT